MLKWITERMSALSTPMPKALVATTVSALPVMNRSWAAVRCSREAPRDRRRPTGAARAQELADHLAALPARRVHDRRPGVAGEDLGQRGELVGIAAGVEGGVAQVGPVEAGDELGRVAEIELIGDIAADDVGRGCRQRDASGAAELAAGLADLRVVGPEVVPPLADAVGLIDRQKRGRTLAIAATKRGLRNRSGAT